MQTKSTLEVVDEELTHISTTAQWLMGRVAKQSEFVLFAILHRVSGVGDIQCFWPLDDMARVRRDIQASIREQSGAQELVFRYRAPSFIGLGSIVLTMADGSPRTAVCITGAVLDYEIVMNVHYCQDDHPAVSAAMVESAIQAGDLAQLKRIVKTTNHLNMGVSKRPIHMAIEHNKPHILQWLVTQPGIDVDRLPLHTNRPTAALLFESIWVPEERCLDIQYLCILLRAGMSPTSAEPLTGFTLFHSLACTNESGIIHVLGQEDITQKLLEYAAYAFEPSANGIRPINARGSISPTFANFFKRAEKALCLVVSVHMPVAVLSDIIVSYITQP